MTHYFASENGTLPADPAWVAIADPTTDYAESYLDATFDNDSIGDKTFYAWFRNVAGGISDRAGDSIVLYAPAGKARDAGQTSCYSATGVITCPTTGNFAGQDAQYEGLLSSYTVGEGLRAGTVRDNVTGLVWRRALDSVGAADGTGARTFTQLEAICANLDLGGYDDWRIPAAREAENFFAYGSENLYPDPFTIPNNITRAWTRTFPPGFPNNKWVLFNISQLSASLTNPRAPVTNLCVRGTSRLSFDYEFTLQDKGTDSTADDTVVESNTGLIWDRRPTTERTWQQSLARCEGSNHDGKTDWRLPSLNELLTLVDYGSVASVRTDPVFGNVVGTLYWTSTTFGASSQVFGVLFSNATYTFNDKTLNFPSICVRNE